MAEIKRRWPKVAVHLQPAAENDALDLVARDAVDIAIISTNGNAPGHGVAVPLYRWRRLVLAPRGHALDSAGRTPALADLACYPLITYESGSHPDSFLRRVFAEAGLAPDLALSALDADVIKTCVRAGLGVGLLAEMAVSAGDTDLRAWPAPAAIPECVTWAVLAQGRVLRDYALELVHELAPQIDIRDLRRVLDGNQVAHWPTPPTWEALTQGISF